MLSRDQVLKIARLARIEVGPDEAAHLERELNGILAMVERMSRVDPRGVEPMAHPAEMSQALRDDRVVEADRRADYQAVAPQVEDGLYLVPKVIE